MGFLSIVCASRNPSTSVTPCRVPISNPAILQSPSLSPQARILLPSVLWPPTTIDCSAARLQWLGRVRVSWIGCICLSCCLSHRIHNPCLARRSPIQPHATLHCPRAARLRHGHVSEDGVTASGQRLFIASAFLHHQERPPHIAPSVRPMSSCFQSLAHSVHTRHGKFARPTLTKPHLIFFPPATDASSRRCKRRRAEAAVPIDSRPIMALGAFTGALPAPPLTPRHGQAAWTANTNTPYSTDWSEFTRLRTSALMHNSGAERNHSLLLSWPQFRAITEMLARTACRNTNCTPTPRRCACAQLPTHPQFRALDVFLRATSICPPP